MAAARGEGRVRPAFGLRSSLVAARAWLRFGRVPREPSGMASARAVVVAARIEQSGNRDSSSTFISSLPLSATPFALEKPDRLVLDLPEVNFQLPAHTGEGGAGLVNPSASACSASALARRHRSRRAGACYVGDECAAPQGSRDRPSPSSSRERTRRLPRICGRRASTQSSTRIVAAEALPDPRRIRARSSFSIRAMAVSIRCDGRRRRGGEDDHPRFRDDARGRARAQGRVRVALTRTTDTFVSLPDRVRFAREQNAALFVSIHADTLGGRARQCARRDGLYLGRPGERCRGGEARGEGKPRRSAGRPRSRAEDGEVVSILDDLMRRETKVLSIAFARKLVEALEPRVRLNKNPLRSAAFVVLARAGRAVRRSSSSAISRARRSRCAHFPAMARGGRACYGGRDRGAHAGKAGRGGVGELNVTVSGLRIAGRRGAPPPQKSPTLHTETVARGHGFPAASLRYH